MVNLASGENLFFFSNYPIIVFKVQPPYGGPDETGLDLTEVKHYHDFTELVIIAEGSGVHWVEGNRIHVSAGDVFLLQGKQEHYFVEPNDLVFYNVMYQPDELNLPMAELKSIPGYHAIFTLDPANQKPNQFKSHLRLPPAELARVEQILKEMWEEIVTKQTGFEAALLAHLLQLLILLSRKYSETSQSKNRQAVMRIAETIRILENEFEKHWKLEELARLSSTSPGNLNRIFQQATGMSPINYLLQVRLQKAMALLTDSSLSIVEIAFQVGFNDSNYFARLFKKTIGLSPSQYRKMQLVS